MITLDPNIRAYLERIDPDEDQERLVIRDGDSNGGYTRTLQQKSQSITYVHVSVSDPDEAVRVLDAVVYYARHGAIVHLTQWHMRDDSANASGVGAACVEWERARDKTHVRVCAFDVHAWNEHAYLVCHVNNPYTCWSD
jgi:hypothetical protein